MATPTLRCARCGYRPSGPMGEGLRPNSACPQCSAPLAAEARAPAPAHALPRPVGLEDRRRVTRADRRGARRSSPLARALTAALAGAMLVTFLGGPRLVGRIRRLVDAVQRGESIPRALQAPGGARGGGVERWGPLGDFHLVAGTWDGEAVGAGGLWTFRFSPPASVEVTEPDGEAWRGEGRVYWERGDEGGLAVLPGGYPFDVALQGGGVALGSYRLEDARTLQLCLGRPDALTRTSEFRAQPGVTCWLLVRRRP